jgi:hypothetical protein
MISFDSHKLSSKKAYLKKITGHYMYIAYNEKQQAFTDFGAQKSVDQEYPQMVRIKIDQAIYQAYTKNYKIMEYQTPHLCAINAYDGVIINIESKQLPFYRPANSLSNNDSDANWKSKFEQSLSSIEQQTANQDAYINGEQIFWIPQQNWQQSQNLSNEGEFQIVTAHYINLNQFKAWYRYLNTAEDTEEKAMTLSISTGHIICYSPTEEIKVYSPVISSSSAHFIHYANNSPSSISTEERNMHLLNSHQNPAYITLEFVLNAAQTIGKLYGYEANDFLNIPRIIADFGQVNLTKIQPNIRMTTPVHIYGIDALAWLMGFMYQEKSIQKQLELVKMFKTIMKKGLIYKNEIKDVFQNHINGIDDIPIIHWQTNPSTIIA